MTSHLELLLGPGAAMYHRQRSDPSRLPMRWLHQHTSIPRSCTASTFPGRRADRSLNICQTTLTRTDVCSRISQVRGGPKIKKSCFLTMFQRTWTPALCRLCKWSPDMADLIKPTIGSSSVDLMTGHYHARDGPASLL